MPTVIYVCRLAVAALLFTLALVVLPYSMAWSAEPLLNQQLCLAPQVA
tara:strand:+ start:1775 stop:1918 length:144 start_codon:yes stop_codon:yes gene_type:complete